VYDGGGAATEVAVDATSADPLIDVDTDDGIRHRVWAITKPELLAAIAGDLRPRRAVIADGHHRYTTYLHLQAERRSAGAPSGAWDYGLTLLVDAKAFGPEVHAIHRVIPSLTVDAAVKAAERAFAVRRLDGDLAANLRELETAGKSGAAFLLVGADERYLLTEPDRPAVAASVPAERSAAWRGLDVTIAHHLLIRTVWGLADTEADVGYAHDVTEALALAEARGGTALLLNPTPVDAVAAVAAAGDRMPRKSTLFTPKPKTGLLMRVFADD
jgi:uncharacterized protein (DUF1015 family)